MKIKIRKKQKKKKGKKLDKLNKKVDKTPKTSKKEKFDYKKLQEKQNRFDYQKTNKPKPLTVYIICKNKQKKEYDIFATRKFNIDDETYVIKEKCCYLKKMENNVKEFSLYNQGNPNPIELKEKFKNMGLTSNELDSYIAGDIFNIIAECQQNDRSKYVLGIAITLLAFAVINFVSGFF